MSMSDLQKIRIGAIVLDRLPQWDDEFKYLPKTVVAERTLSGHVVTQTYMGYGGRPITLVGSANTGWQKRSTVEALIAMAADVGVETFTVDFLGTPTVNPTPPPNELENVLVSYTCRFRQEEAPAVEFSPVTDVDNPDANFWYTGTIKLITT